MLEKGANINAADRHGRTALLFAASNGNEKIVELLLEKGADIQVAPGNRTLLMIAAGNGNEKMVELFLEKGADVNAVDHRGWTALLFAAKKGNEKIVELLLEKGADVNAASQVLPRQRLSR